MAIDNWKDGSIIGIIGQSIWHKDHRVAVVLATVIVFICLPNGLANNFNLSDDYVCALVFRFSIMVTTTTTSSSSTTIITRTTTLPETNRSL